MDPKNRYTASVLTPLTKYQTDSTKTNIEMSRKEFLEQSNATYSSRQTSIRRYSQISSGSSSTSISMVTQQSQFGNNLITKSELDNKIGVTSKNMFPNLMKEFTFNLPTSPLSKLRDTHNHLSTNSTYFQSPKLTTSKTDPSFEKPIETHNFRSLNLIEPKLIEPQKSIPKPTKSLNTGDIKKLGPPKYYVLNFNNFDKNKDYCLAKREGSEKDVDALVKTFKIFNMTGKIYRDLKLKELNKKMDKISKENFSQHSAIVMSIMSHGGQSSKLYAKDGIFSLHSTIIEPLLKNKHLDGKPIILFVESCKGEIDPRWSLDTNNSGSNILIFEATFENFVSFRSKENGSIFTQSLCRKIQETGKYKNVRDICYDVINDVTAILGKIQTPTITTNLTKDYCFGDYC